MGKKLLYSFLFGGCIGAVGHAFIMVVSGFVPDPTLATIIAMLLFGLVSAVVIGTGLYDKMAAVVGFAADQPLCGLMYGATKVAGAEKANGAPNGKAFVSGFVKVMIIVGIGYIISAVLGIIIG